MKRPEAIVYTKEVVEDLFKQLDLNGDGKVTSDEFSKKEVDTAIAKASRAAHAEQMIFEYIYIDDIRLRNLSLVHPEVKLFQTAVFQKS